MAEGKKSFVLYTDTIHVVEKLDDVKAGLLFKHLLRYVNDLNPITDDFIVDIAFEPIKQQLKRDLRDWEERKETKSESGILGNLKRWNIDLYNKVSSGELKIEDAVNIAKGRKTSHSDENIANIAVNVSVNDSVSVNVNDTKQIGGEIEKKQKEDMIVLEMMKVWNKYNPNYLTQDELDYSACLEMAYKIAKVKGWKKQTVLYEKQNDCVASWEKIVLFIRSDSFLKKLAVQNINNQFQMVIQKMTNPDEVKEVKTMERQNPTIKPVSEEMLAKYK